MTKTTIINLEDDDAEDDCDNDDDHENVDAGDEDANDVGYNGDDDKSDDDDDDDFLSVPSAKKCDLIKKCKATFSASYRRRLLMLKPPTPSPCSPLVRCAPPPSTSGAT